MGNDNHEGRTLKTLLLCKIKPDIIREPGDQIHYVDIYREEICKRSGPNSNSYFTIGNADAVTIYDTAKPDDQMWFNKIYEDKQNVIGRTNDRVNYHPIHLVANRKYDSVSMRDHPVCIVTLIYGISDDKEASTENELDDETDLSRYEKAIEKFLNKAIFTKHLCNSDVDFQIFNAVNICDAVVLWYSNDIQKTLLLSDSLARDGFARQTFTLIGLGLSDNGNILPEAYDIITNGTGRHDYNVQLRGSIRDQGEYVTLVNDLKTEFEDCSVIIKDYYAFGQFDFTIFLLKLNNDRFKQFIQFLMRPNSGSQIAKACWEIHSELLYEQTNDDSKGQGVNKNITHNRNIGPVAILDRAYSNCLELTKAMNKEMFPWFNAFCELINMHANIDRDPILYGPGYLIYDFIQIALFYMNEVNDKESREKAVKMLQHSRDTIQAFLRGLSTLTDQMMRIDDLVFHGFGNNSSLYNTLPACALDFYHAFILEFVQLFVDVDGELGRLLGNREDYHFDFLLIPELDRGISIEPVFAEDYWDIPACKRRCLWPQKQAFLVHFPIETVYDPVEFFAPLVHECFHYLGDTFRNRGKRVDYVCGYFAAIIATNLYVNRPIECKQKLTQSVFTIMSQGIFETEEMLNISEEPTLSETCECIQSGIRKLFMPTGLDEVRKDLNNDLSLYSSKILKQWAFGSMTLCFPDHFWDEKDSCVDWGCIWEDCNYYFKECYADLMMVLTLGLTPKVYLALFVDTVHNANLELDDIMLTRIALRIALVISVVSKSRYAFIQEDIRNSYSQENLKKELCGFFEDVEFFRLLYACYNSLIDNNAGMDLENHILCKLPPRAAMQYIADYLFDVISDFNNVFNGFSAKGHQLRGRLSDIQKTFKHIFVEGNFLSKDFFEIIHKHHKAIRTHHQNSN